MINVCVIDNIYLYVESVEQNKDDQIDVVHISFEGRSC